MAVFAGYHFSCLLGLQANACELYCSRAVVQAYHYIPPFTKTLTLYWQVLLASQTTRRLMGCTTILGLLDISTFILLRFAP